MPTSPTEATRRPPAVRRRRGFTLMELLASLVTYAVLLTAVASALVIVLRAKPRTDGAWQVRFDAATVAAQFAADLAGATSLADHSAHAAEFTVADRDGDLADDTLRYAWSGTAGDPLLYTYNQQPAAVLAQGVRAFDLTWLAGTARDDPLEEELAVLIYHDDAPGGSLKDYGIDATHWCAQYSLPSFPGGTTTWKIKRIRIMARLDGTKTDGVMKVMVTAANAALQPTSTIYDVVTLRETSLGSGFAWVDLDFTSVNDLDPAKGVCVVVAFASGTDKAAKVQYERDGNPMTMGTHWMTSSDGGKTWTGQQTTSDMRFYVYGTYDTNAGSGTIQPMTAVQFAIQLGDDPAARIESATRLLNAPEVVQP